MFELLPFYIYTEVSPILSSNCSGHPKPVLIGNEEMPIDEIRSHGEKSS